MFEWLFPDTGEMELGQLIFMLTVFSFILIKSSELISHGSEMLLLLYGPGIVGGLVLPILGAIPDCAVILIAGMAQGTPEEIEAQISVGVGALVGSTVFVLTIPWALMVFVGRRDWDPELDCAGVTENNKPKLTHFSLTTNCVTVLGEIPQSAKIMMLATLSYLLIQVPAGWYHSDRDGGVRREKPWELVTLAGTVVSFIAYCMSSVLSASATDMDRRKQEALRREQWKRSLDTTMGQEERQELVFRQFDTDNSGFMEPGELSAALAHLGLKVDRRDLGDIFQAMDAGDADGIGAGDGKISLQEFKAAVNLWVSAGQSAEGMRKAAQHTHHKHHASNDVNGSFSITSPDGQRPSVRRATSLVSPRGEAPIDIASESTPLKLQRQPSVKNVSIARPAGDEDCEEEPEEEHWHLTDGELKIQAVLLLLAGTACVTVFTDPMVETLGNIGARLDISPFYIAFAVIPLISSASELVAGLNFARKKTNESISMTLATFHGTASINSTLCLAVFLSIVYFRSLTWSYTAEVAAVLLVVTVTAAMSMRRNIFLWQAVVVAAMYPTSIILVYVMENVFGYD